MLPLDTPRNGQPYLSSARLCSGGVIPANDQESFRDTYKETVSSLSGGFGPQTAESKALERGPTKLGRSEDLCAEYPYEDTYFQVSSTSPDMDTQIFETRGPNTFGVEKTHGAMKTPSAFSGPHVARVDLAAEFRMTPENTECWNRRATVTVCEMEAEVSPVEPSQDISYPPVVESIAPEVEHALCKRAEGLGEATVRLAIPKETHHSGCSNGEDDEVEFDAIMWNRESKQDGICYRPTAASPGVVNDSQDNGDGFVVVGPGVQILEDVSDSPYGVPVSKASVDVARRESGIRFTLTCIEEGYEDAEVLFDDDFLYEEEMMDPNYFHKKESGGGARPTPRPALLRISTY